MYGEKIIGLGGFNRTKKELKNLSKDINLIYKHTFKDYRSNSEGIPKILYLDENEETVLSPIENLPKKIFYERLKYAKRKEKITGLGAVRIGAIKKQLFEEIYKKYRNKNYFFTDDRIKRKLKEWEYFKKQGDKNALKVKKTQIVNFIEKDNKDKAYYVFSSIKNAIDNNDKEFLISRIRYDQPFSKEIYEKITKTKLPKTNKAIKDFFK